MEGRKKNKVTPISGNSVNERLGQDQNQQKGYNQTNGYERNKNQPKQRQGRKGSHKYV